MKNKDIIVRVGGSNQEATAYLNELQEEALKLGLIAEQPVIKSVPKRVEKDKIQNRKAKDLKIAVTGLENKVETVMQLIVDAIEQELSLTPSSINIKLESNKDEPEK